MNWDELSFVERVVAGYPPAIIQLAGIIFGLIVAILITRWLVKTQVFKIGLIVFVLLVIAGFIMDAEAMIRSVNHLGNWLHGKLLEE